MTIIGLTSAGLVIPTASDLKVQIDDGFRSAFGASFGGAVADTVSNIVSAAQAECWEVLEQVHNNRDPDAATGTGLEAVGALTGAVKISEAPSLVTLTLTGTPATIVNAGTGALTVSTGAEFDTRVSATIAAVAAWVGATAYAVGNRVTNASRVYQCTAAGTSAGSGGPTTQALTITDGAGTLVWAWTGNGTGAVDVLAAATVNGPTAAVARDVTLIKNPVGGLQNITNLSSAIPGRSVESDADFRVRRELELAGAGAATAANIRALLLKISGVTAAHVFKNLTEVTDSDGVPPHAIEVLVQGGADQDIVDLLGEEVTTSTVTVGTSSGVHVDSEGVSTAIHFTRPSSVVSNLDVTLTVDASVYAGDTVAQTAIATYGANVQVIGKDLVPGSAAASTLPVIVLGQQVAGVAGVLKVADVRAFTDTITTGAAWLPTTAYSASVGVRSVVTNDGRAYICITSGTSAGSGGPTGTGTNITDGTAHWYWLGADIVTGSRQIATITTVNIHSSAATP